MKDSMKALSALTDEELAVRYMNGDNDAFDLILKHNQSKLFTYIFYIVRDEEKANDFFRTHSSRSSPSCSVECILHQASSWHGVCVSPTMSSWISIVMSVTL